MDACVARAVLAIRTSALGELAVVVWPVTEAPPKSGSWSNALQPVPPRSAPATSVCPLRQTADAAATRHMLRNAHTFPVELR